MNLDMGVKPIPFRFTACYTIDITIYDIDPLVPLLLFYQHQHLLVFVQHPIYLHGLYVFQHVSYTIYKSIVGGPQVRIELTPIASQASMHIHYTTTATKQMTGFEPATYRFEGDISIHVELHLHMQTGGIEPPI